MILDPQSILFGPTTLDAVVKRIMRMISVTFGPISDADLVTSQNSEDHILPFEMQTRDGNGSGFESKRASLVRKIIVSFMRECLDVDVSYY